MAYKLLFFDTETTGNREEDRLCQIAYKYDGETVSELFKPPLPIQIDAMMVHHITNKMIADKPTFEFSATYKHLHDKAHDENTVFIAHNAPFDLSMLKHEGIIPIKSICTLKVARAVDEAAKIPSYKLQYLRYLLDIDIEATAHDALGDVLVLEKVYDYFEKKVIEKNSCDAATAIEIMMEISSKPSLLRNINFGKHKGKTIEEVAKADKGYLEWLYNEKKKNPKDEADWLYTLEYYLK
ncbi:MAG: hypothetical protein RL641_618 [Candidatus Parcubacteria bacterium]|jgi:DNA polymerase III epsilon subunit-like protein